MNDKGEKEMDTLSVSSALQIAGRAGRWVHIFSVFENMLFQFFLVMAHNGKREK